MSGVRQHHCSVCFKTKLLKTFNTNGVWLRSPFKTYAMYQAIKNLSFVWELSWSGLCHIHCILHCNNVYFYPGSKDLILKVWNARADHSWLVLELCPWLHLTKIRPLYTMRWNWIQSFIEITIQKHSLAYKGTWAEKPPSILLKLESFCIPYVSIFCNKVNLF